VECLARMQSDRSDRIEFPLFDADEKVFPQKARQLKVSICSISHARKMNEKWHSRMPETQPSPWQFAFSAHYMGITYGVALWHNPSARTLPGHWLELRRLAISPDAPHCTATRMLGEMARYFKSNAKDREKLISYQDMEVHKGTIWTAAGWQLTNITKVRERDRSTKRPSGKMYRMDANGKQAQTSAKARWELVW